MSVGISTTLQVIGATRDAGLELVALGKEGGFSLLKLGTFVSILGQLMGDVQTIVKDVPGIFPEISDLDSAEIGQLTTALYQAAVDIYKSAES